MPQLRIAFIHPDLGIGGAERLIVDAAVGLQNLGHIVTVYTSHCDPNHCFEEVKDGTLDVRIRGNWIIPRNLAGYFTILCAILRQFHLTLSLLLYDTARYDAIIVDQLSACVPLLRLQSKNVKLLFYCHFPDKLLARHSGLLRSFWRFTFDYLEGWTTGMADIILVNSRFTGSIFRQAFPLIQVTPTVLYPGIDPSLGKFNASASEKTPDWMRYVRGKRVVLSINRFEDKKNVVITIKSLAALSKHPDFRSILLIIAGGYDKDVQENLTNHRSLQIAAKSWSLSHYTLGPDFGDNLKIPPDTSVLFLLSVSTAIRNALLQHADMVVYTPAFEHFGIVPLEAMLASKPVLAINSGGPLETIKDNETGWLRPENEWTRTLKIAMLELDASKRASMGAAGRAHVQANFSLRAMATQLEKHVMTAQRRDKLSFNPFITLSVIVTMLSLIAGFVVAGYLQ